MCTHINIQFNRVDVTTGWLATEEVWAEAPLKTYHVSIGWYSVCTRLYTLRVPAHLHSQLWYCEDICNSTYLYIYGVLYNIYIYTCIHIIDVHTEAHWNTQTLFGWYDVSQPLCSEEHRVPLWPGIPETDYLLPKSKQFEKKDIRQLRDSSWAVKS